MGMHWIAQEKRIQTEEILEMSINELLHFMATHGLAKKMEIETRKIGESRRVREVRRQRRDCFHGKEWSPVLKSTVRTDIVQELGNMEVTADLGVNCFNKRKGLIG